jgi:hypothetical protein
MIHDDEENTTMDQPANLPEPQVRVSRYTVTCVPPDSAPDASIWAVHVTEQRDGKWIAEHHGSWINGEGDWEIGYSGAYAACAHDLETALRLAKAAAPEIRINGYTVAEALRMSDARKEVTR